MSRTDDAYIDQVNSTKDLRAEAEWLTAVALMPGSKYAAIARRINKAADRLEKLERWLIEAQHERNATHARVAALEAERDMAYMDGYEVCKEEYRPQVIELEDRVAELTEHLIAICEMQQRLYGRGFDTHYELSDLCSAARAALAKPQEGK